MFCFDFMIEIEQEKNGLISLRTICYIKGVYINMFGHKCELAVCEHNHPTMIKTHPLLIFKSPFNQVCQGWGWSEDSMVQEMGFY